MKKTLAIVMTLVMLVAMTVPAFAGPGSFITSPSNNGAPELISVESECDGKLIITPYKERGTLSDESKSEFEASYAQIAAATDLTEVNKDLIQIASAKKIGTQDLAVSDLFYAHVEDCTVHAPAAATYSLRTRTAAVNHGTYTITVKTETLTNYVALMNYVDGAWVLVDDASVTDEGNLKFTTDTLGAFAIVVSTAPVQSGDLFTIASVSCFAIVAVAMIVVLVKTKKRV